MRLRAPWLTAWPARLVPLVTRLDRRDAARGPLPGRYLHPWGATLADGPGVRISGFAQDCRDWAPHANTCCSGHPLTPPPLPPPPLPPLPPGTGRGCNHQIRLFSGCFGVIEAHGGTSFRTPIDTLHATCCILLGGIAGCWLLSADQWPLQPPARCPPLTSGSPSGNLLTVVFTIFFPCPQPVLRLSVDQSGLRAERTNPSEH